MPTFVLFCVDKPGSLDLRMATREAHLAYVRDKAAMVKLGGPMLNDEGEMAGSLLIVEAPDRAAAIELNAHDPYTGGCEGVQGHPWPALSPITPPAQSAASGSAA